MPHRAQVVVPATSLLPEDSIVNTWGFELFTDEGVACPIVETALKTFYDAWATNRSSLYVWDGARIKWYDLAQPKPRPPVRDVSLGLSTTKGATSLPTEVALCMSFQQFKAAGEIQRRKRGRVYLGPFVTNANQGTTAQPDSTFHTQIRNAAQAFLTASRASLANWQWVVISEATGVVVPYQVDEGWVDNAWDTQRRRGKISTSRLLFSVTP